MAQKRTLDSFFNVTTSKKPRTSSPAAESSATASIADISAPSLLESSTSTSATPADISAACTLDSADSTSTDVPQSHHTSYPFPIPHLPSHLAITLNDEIPASAGKEIANQPDLDLLYFQPYIPASIERELFLFLRRELFFYRVKYKTKRAGVDTEITTPRYTTVFGVDSTSVFNPSGTLHARPPNPPPDYSCTPRPIPACLDTLRELTELFTGASYNFCLVNYYASGADSISYHSDDERFLGPDPAIASLSLGARRDFYMRRKGPASAGAASASKASKAAPVKLSLGSGDMVLMRGHTQAAWEHSIPKRSGTDASSGRMNITFRKALARGGTENYYRYNVGNGQPWRWDVPTKQMKEWRNEK